MSKDSLFFDISAVSLNKHGEELCGDQVKYLRTTAKTIIVLSDGLGSGVKANILARLTAEIIVTMLRENTPLRDVIETVMGTLPTCRVRKIAYATFVILEINNRTREFQIINFDSPSVFFMKRGRLTELAEEKQAILGKTLRLSQGKLERGDFLGLISDGVLFAGKGVVMNAGWGPAQIGGFLQENFNPRMASAEGVVNRLVRKTKTLYESEIGDDATFVGVLARKPNRLMIFTGPPADPGKDEACVERLLGFDGRKVVCGGTTSEIVAANLGEIIKTDATTLRDDVPPMASLSEIDLVTEGVLTLAKALRLLKKCQGDQRQLAGDRNGANLLALEMLRADSIQFLAGEAMNPYFHNPLLPRNVSIRRNLLEELAEILRNLHKEVTVEAC